MQQMDTGNVKKMLDEARPGELDVLDVRQEWEYEEFHLPGAILVPLPELPDKMAGLHRERRILVYCRSGNRSMAAASLLESHGFRDVVNMDGGMSAWQGATAVEGVLSGMEFFPKIMETADVYRFGYGMERVLEAFYRRMAEIAPTRESADLFQTLAGFEEAHMRSLYIRYGRTSESPLPREEFEKQALAETGEGGRDPEAYFADSLTSLVDLRGIVETSMMIEAQALDYYQRCARQPEHADSAEVLLVLAREEQGHLRMLGNYLKKSAESSNFL
ncbi:MAG: rhodanese-like domain-containing protein [Desulfovibrionaceae bacterium]